MPGPIAPSPFPPRFGRPPAGPGTPVSVPEKTPGPTPVTPSRARPTRKDRPRYRAPSPTETLLSGLIIAFTGLVQRARAAAGTAP